MAGGRPTDYSTALADEICIRLSEGESLRKICGSDDMPVRSTVYLWALRIREFSDRYRRAREMQADSIIDDTQEIADAATPDDWTVARLRVHTRQWAASKLAPKKYGNLQHVDMTVMKAVVKREPKEIEAERMAKKDTWQHSHSNGKTPPTIQ